jgi:hypothetical protein
VTIAIAAMAEFTGQIVTASDARLSHGESLPAAEGALLKNRKIARKWGMMFAATDSTSFLPVLNETQRRLNYTGDSNSDIDPETVCKAVQAAYEKEFNERFFREHLARFGYADIAEFRRDGFSEMGKDLYSDYALKLAKFDLGLELLVYGAFEQTVHLFEVVNPGKISDHGLRGYAAIGSGSTMALAALTRQPRRVALHEIIFRVLDAKFSAETARDVGKETHVITLNTEGKIGWMSARYRNDPPILG